MLTRSLNPSLILLEPFKYTNIVYPFEAFAQQEDVSRSTVLQGTTRHGPIIPAKAMSMRC